MAINIFEGARRIIKLLAILWVAGWVVAAFDVKPTVNAGYKILYPGATPLRMEAECPADGVIELEDKVTTHATKVFVTLCFPAQSADDGERLIPYLVAADGKIWMRERYSTEVGEYTQLVADKFVIPTSDEEEIDRQWWPLFLKEIGWGALWMISGLLLLFALAWTIGWIVRGFMGIPLGQDHKEKGTVK